MYRAIPAHTRLTTAPLRWSGCTQERPVSTSVERRPEKAFRSNSLSETGCRPARRAPAAACGSNRRCRRSCRRAPRGGRRTRRSSRIETGLQGIEVGPHLLGENLVPQLLRGEHFFVRVGHEQGVPRRIGRELDTRLISADEELRRRHEHCVPATWKPRRVPIDDRLVHVELIAGSQAFLRVRQTPKAAERYIAQRPSKRENLSPCGP